MGQVEGLSHNEVFKVIPASWWLTSPKTKGLLAKMVHRCKKEISQVVSTLPAGRNRVEQHCIANDHVSEERTVASGMHKITDVEGNCQHRLELTVAKLAMSKTINDNISFQL